MKNSCPVCRGVRTAHLFDSRDRVYGLPGIFLVFRCSECRAIFYEPRLGEKELSAYYPESYGRYRHSRAIGRKRYDGIRRFVLENRYGYPPSDGRKASRFQRGAAIFLSLFIAKGAPPYRGEGKILDVGCGGGSYLYRLKQWGWRGYGVEPSAAGAAQAQALGLDVVQGNVAEASFPDEFFDVVRLSHVLEHLGDPHGSLREIRRILKKDGIVDVTVPNTGSLNFWLFGADWYALDVPRHVISYAPETLRTLCSAAGFEIERLRFRSGPFNFVRSMAYMVEERSQIGFGLLPRIDWKKSKLVRRASKPFFFLVDLVGYGDVMRATLGKAL